MEVPVLAVYPPPGLQEITSTPGATRSGLIRELSKGPLPLKVAYVLVLALYAPTVITFPAVPGIVTVFSVVPVKKAVWLPMLLPGWQPDLHQSIRYLHRFKGKSPNAALYLAVPRRHFHQKFPLEYIGRRFSLVYLDHRPS